MTDNQENAREIMGAIQERIASGDTSDLDEDGFIPCDYML